MRHDSVHVLTVVGARPQFVKAAVVSRALREAGLTEFVVHTGQHFDDNMSDVFFRELEMARPDAQLAIHGGDHGEMTARMLEQLERLLKDVGPSIVMVYGDTNSTLAGALAAAKLNIPVAHVEAGLRSFDRTMPEEVNRVVADHLSALLLAPTFQSVDNLANEGIVAGVHHVGDVMYDATLWLSELATTRSTIVADLGLLTGDYHLATLHRASTTESREALGRALDYLRDFDAERLVVLPLHPRTRNAAREHGLSLDGLKVIDPVGPLDMHALIAGADHVLTDSGGLQKEAYFHRKPCVTLRDSSEWVETIEAGWNRLWAEPPALRDRSEISDYGRGDSARLVVERVKELLGP